MIIKSVYINHFGCLKEKHIEFDSGLNVISLPNESGKSTVAEFIRVMLYGVNSLRFNQRKKYMPFGCTSMGGEMTVELDGTDYIIKRTFGNRKSDDKIEVVNALNGAKIKEYSIDNVGGVMCGIGGDAYENTCYIKQLSAKINDVKSSEIQSKLINLTQNNNENYSYKKAVEILDNAIKDLKGPRGKINQTQSVLNELAVKNAERNKIRAEYEQVNIRLQDLKKNGGVNTGNKKLLLGWIPFGIITAITLAIGIKPILIALFIASLSIAILITAKMRKNTNVALEHAKQTGFYESRLEMLKNQYKAIDVSQMDFYKEKLLKYNKNLTDLNVAKDALSKAFEQLQTDYSPKLNGKACEVLRSITDGKYTEFLVDEDYNITVRNDENVLVSSEYLSSGTFDQIYFSLRMALISLVAGEMPIILDDAFALYDDERVKRAIEYLRTLDNQVIILSCQSREKQYVPINT